MITTSAVCAVTLLVVPAWLMVLTGHDLRSRTLPNRLTVPAVIAATAAATCHGGVALSVLALSVPYLLTCLAGGCGGGDVKLAAALGGLVADPGRSLVVVVAASLLSLAAAGVIAVRGRGSDGRAPRPHGPALVAAALIAGGLPPAG
ncbi:A24 family peptidase [Williamsia herbipolensis]|uniref:A24 family peptidase n=1 Tax=Williamsia herbipolensis TaxID=1603258 RepID=A0AAU4K3D6_9NOCA|nr:A24 family peptidase [Williamsia herbipolensis]